jgi:hypothetical protein
LLTIIIICREPTRVAAPNPIPPAERKPIGASTTHHQQTAKEPETAKAAAQKIAMQNAKKKKVVTHYVHTDRDFDEEITGWMII